MHRGAVPQLIPALGRALSLPPAHSTLPAAPVPSLLPALLAGRQGPLGLSVRGTGGEHTPIGADGTVDISPRARLFIKEAEIIEALYKGLASLLDAEAKAA